LGSDIVPYPSRSPLIFTVKTDKYVSPLQRACKMGSGIMRVDSKNTFAIDITIGTCEEGFGIDVG